MPTNGKAILHKFKLEAQTQCVKQRRRRQHYCK